MITKNHESGPNKLLHGDTVYSIVGAAFNVIEELGPGFHEKPYENALVVELRHKQHSIDQQRRFQLAY